MDIKNMRYKRLQSLKFQNHMQQEHSESAWEWRVALYKNNQQQDVSDIRFWNISFDRKSPVCYQNKLP